MEVYVLALIGVTLILISFITSIRKYNVYKHGVRVIGKIIDLQKGDEAVVDEFNQIIFITLYKPVIKFTSLDGEEVIFVYNDPGSKKNYKVGDEITVVCNKKNKNDFYVDSKMEFFRVSLLLLVLSILFFSFAFTLYII